MVMGGRGYTRAIGGAGVCTHHLCVWGGGVGGAHTTQRQGHPRHRVAGGIMHPVAQGLLPFAKGITSS